MKAKAIYESDVIEIVIYSCVAFVLMGLVLILFFYFSRKKIIQKELEKKDLDILFHVLNHSVYHRAQIVLDLKQQDLKYPSFQFITFRN